VTGPAAIGAAELFRDVGLLADGPVILGRPIPARGGGVFVIELPAPLPTAPIELTRVGKWIERVPGLRLDGGRPTSRALAARLARFWIPSTAVLFVGAVEGSISGRLAAMAQTPLGERRPSASGHWLWALGGLDRARVWWAATEAVEEYEDALLGAFAGHVPAAEAAALHDSTVVLPFANLRTPTGERKATGLSGSLPPAEASPVVPPTRVVDLPPGDAEGARGLPPARAARGTVRAPRARTAPGRGGAGPAPREAASPAPPIPPADDAPTLSAEGAERLRAELAELTRTKRPEVIARIRAAKELGDLRENADYTAAREEQSFLEGRISTIEAILRSARVAEAPPAGLPAGGAAGGGGVAAQRTTAAFGSRVTIEQVDPDGDETTYELVGTAEANAGAGRISVASPVGRALLGRAVGETVEVTTPRGPVRYRITGLG
jgi:transcription elongation factor GreA